MSVRPLIGCVTTPFFNLAPVSAASSPHTPPPYILCPPDAPIPCPVVDNYETIQSSYFQEELPIWHLSCIACVDAYDTTVAQHFCESNQYCRSALNTARIRRDTWLVLSKQGESMIESGRKRFCPLEIGDNVRVPIPIGPLSLIDTMTDIYSDGGAFKIGTKHGTIQSAFTRSDITPCGTNQLFLPTDVPNKELSVRTAARLEVGGPSIISCHCKKSYQSNRCMCYKKQVKCNSKCHGSATCNNKH